MACCLVRTACRTSILLNKFRTRDYLVDVPGQPRCSLLKLRQTYHSLVTVRLNRSEHLLFLLQPLPLRSSQERTLLHIWGSFIRVVANDYTSSFLTISLIESFHISDHFNIRSSPGHVTWNSVIVPFWMTASTLTSMVLLENSQKIFKSNIFPSLDFGSIYLYIDHVLPVPPPRCLDRGVKLVLSHCFHFIGCSVHIPSHKVHFIHFFKLNLNCNPLPVIGSRRSHSATLHAEDWHLTNNNLSIHIEPKPPATSPNGVHFLTTVRFSLEPLLFSHHFFFFSSYLSFLVRIFRTDALLVIVLNQSIVSFNFAPSIDQFN